MVLLYMLFVVPVAMPGASVIMGFLLQLCDSSAGCAAVRKFVPSPENIGVGLCNGDLQSLAVSCTRF